MVSQQEKNTRTNTLAQLHSFQENFLKPVVYFLCKTYKLLFIQDRIIKNKRQLNHWKSHPIQNDDSLKLQPWSSLYNFHRAYLKGESPSPGNWYLVNLVNFRNFLEIWGILLSELYELYLGLEAQGAAYRKQMLQRGKSYTILMFLILWAMGHVP